jgi:hypothetical protein
MIVAKTPSNLPLRKKSTAYNLYVLSIANQIGPVNSGSGKGQLRRIALSEARFQA